MKNNDREDWEPTPEMVEAAAECVAERNEKAEALEEEQAAFQEYMDDRQQEEELERRSRYFPADTLPGLFARPAPPIRAYVDKLMYAGAITILAGDPKSGKTTLLLHVLNALTHGKEFLWGKCQRTTVLYASEQSEVSFKEQVRRVSGLKDSMSFRVILFEDNRIEKEFSDEGHRVKRKVFPTTWEEQIELWNQAIKKNRAKVLVVDTFTAFSNFKSNEAFDPGVVQARLQALKKLFVDSPALSIMILHHLRKEFNRFGGDQKARNFSDIANSYALRAGSDQNILIFQPHEDSNVRTLKIEGRFSDGAEQFDVVLKDGEFKLSKEDVEPAAAEDPQQIIAEALERDSGLHELSGRDLAKRLKVTLHQVQKFRKQLNGGVASLAEKAD